MTGTVSLSTAGMTLDDVIAVARDGARVELSDASIAAMTASRAQVDALARAATPVYGISTGFGALANRHIPVESRVQLQRSLIRSHAAGMGPAVEREVVRALMLLRAQDAGQRPHRRPPRGRRRPWRPCSTPGSRRSSTSSARSAAAATSPRSRTARWCSWARARAVGRRRRRAPGARAAGRGRDRARRAAGEGGPGPHQRHRRHARHAHHGDRRPRAPVRRRRHRPPR